MNPLDTAYNGVPLINGEEYAWGDIKTSINGVPVTGMSPSATATSRTSRTTMVPGVTL